jgi:hypothetical protein
MKNLKANKYFFIDVQKNSGKKKKNQNKQHKYLEEKGCINCG